jgi:VanZ family protein
MGKKLFILFWCGGILFPMAAVSRLNPAANSLFNTIFAADWVHILMHLFLYTALAGCLAWVLQDMSGKGLLKILGVCLFIGLLQESLQVYSTPHNPGWPEAFDLLVDLVGAWIGIGIYQLVMYIRNKRAAPKA